MLNNIDISIIIPVYNVGQYIAECIESVMAQQTGVRLECLIVDDCSPDNSMTIAEDIISNYAGPIDFRIIRHEKNRGLSAARNTGIRAARGRYVYFLDSDDYITPDCIASLADAAIMYPKAEIITGDFQTFPQKYLYKSLMLEGKEIPEASCDIRWIHTNWFSVIPEIAVNKLISTDWLRRNKLYFKENILHEDTHWRTLIYTHVTAVAFVNKKTYLYRIRQGSITQSEGAMQRRVRNLGILYSDLFSKPLGWDAPLLKWAFNALTEMKYGERMGFDIKLAEEQYRMMIHSFKKNRSMPRLARLMAIYHSLPRGLMHGRLITLVIDKCIK